MNGPYTARRGQLCTPPVELAHRSPAELSDRGHRWRPYRCPWPLAVLVCPWARGRTRRGAERTAGRVQSAAQRKPMWPVELSGVLAVRAATR
jgi:hypothetical protein